LVEKYKLTEKKGETGIGTFYVLKGLIGLKKGSNKIKESPAPNKELSQKIK